MGTNFSLILCLCYDFSDEREFTREEHHSLEIVSKDASSYKGSRKGDATPDKPRIVSLPKRVGKRKRGRPSGTSTKKGKSVVNLSRRTRPRVGKKPAKIYEYESDKGASSDDKEDFEVSSINNGSSEMVDNKGRSCFNQPRRTRAQLRNKPAEIGGNELDEGTVAEEQTMNEDFEVSRTNRGPSETSELLIPNFQKEEALKDSTLERGKAVEQGVTEHSNCGQRFDEINEVRTGQGCSIQYNDRLEGNVDPVQAMLLNMVPILATKKVESANPVPEEVKARGSDPVNEEEKLPLDAEMQPVKKRKVSYKDVASELLRDW